MACSSCGHKTIKRPAPQRVQEMKTAPAQNLIVEQSDTAEKVKLRYYGGGMTRQTSGCASCGSQGKYALTTSEAIQFASDDAPMGWFSQVFSVGQDYYVTKKQAERLLKETFTNPSGQVVNKFKVIE